MSSLKLQTLDHKPWLQFHPIYFKKMQNGNFFLFVASFLLPSNVLFPDGRSCGTVYKIIAQVRISYFELRPNPESGYVSELFGF